MKPFQAEFVVLRRVSATDNIATVPFELDLEWKRANDGPELKMETEIEFQVY